MSTSAVNHFMPKRKDLKVKIPLLNMAGLITPEEEKKLLERLLEYYKKIYPNINFSIEEKILNKEKLGEVLYTYQGEEIEATADIIIRRISTAITHGYNTPIILLEKPKTKELILLDGHRRILCAYNFGIEWKAFIIKPDKDASFGIEKNILGKVKERQFKALKEY